MKRTAPSILVLSAAIGIIVGFGVNQLLAASGRPTFAPAETLPILLVLLGAIVLVLAWQIYRAIRSNPPVPVNPFRALRIAMLAKASSIVGAALGGLALGLILFLLTRPVVPSIGSMTPMIATAVSGALLVAAALVAEHLCTIRKDDDDEQPGGTDPGLADPGTTPSHH